MSYGPWVAHAAMHGLADAAATIKRPLQLVTNNIAPMELPATETIIDLWRKGYVALTDMQAALGNKGVSMDVSNYEIGQPSSGALSLCATIWGAVAFGGGEMPTTGEMLELSNRFLQTPGTLSDNLKVIGYVRPEVRNAIANLRYDIPGPADLVRFSVRHFWEPDLLKQFTYGAEFPGQIIDLWHAMKGLDYNLFTGPFKAQINQIYNDPNAAANLAASYVAAVGSEPSWAKAYWYSHWVLPSPTQGYLMWQRLNPDRNHKWDADEMVGQNFSFNDLELLLRANDYPQYYRPKLAAISHAIPGIRFMRDFVKDGVYSYDDIIDWARRQGYAPLDQKNIADDVWAEVGQGAAPKKDTACFNANKQAFLAGLVTPEDAVANLAACAIGPEQAQDAVTLWGIGLQVKRANELHAAIRKMFIKGQIDEKKARQMMSTFGFAGSAQDDWITDWRVEMMAEGKEATGAQLVKYACQGLLPLDQLAGRLTNLGYDAQAVQLMVDDAKYCKNNMLIRQAAQLAKQLQQTAKQQQQQIREAAQALKTAQRCLSSHGSPSDLRKWYCQGYISEQEVSSRLSFLGWPLLDQSRFIADCTGVRDSQLEGLRGRAITPGATLTPEQACPGGA